MKGTNYLIVVMIGLAFVITGCASNQVRSAWDDPECLWQVREAYFMGYGIGYDDAKDERNYNPVGLEKMGEAHRACGYPEELQK